MENVRVHTIVVDARVRTFANANFHFLVTLVSLLWYERVWLEKRYWFLCILGCRDLSSYDFCDSICLIVE